MVKRKQKTWVIEVKAEIKNFADEGFDIEDKSHIRSLVKQGLDIGNTFAGTLGEFRTKIKELKVTQKKEKKNNGTNK